jgi:signal transduction histidine kinase
VRRTGDDTRLVHRAALLVAAQTAAAVAIVVAVVALLALSLAVKDQARDTERQAYNAAKDYNSFQHPPPGVTMIGRYPNSGRITASPGARVELTALDLTALPKGYSKLTVGEQQYQLYVWDPSDRRVVAAIDLSVAGRESQRLINSLIIAGGVGIAAAALVGWFLARRAVKPLGDALTLQRRFVADASHELRTPLTILHTRAQLLRRRAGPDPATQEGLDRLIADTRALTEIVNDLLLSAEMEHRPDSHQRVDLAALARDVADGLAPAADQAGVTVTAGGEPVTVAGVPAALRRAVYALVDNALGHNHPGGTVTLTVARQGQDAVLTVVDDGDGLDPAKAAELTKRFARGAGAAGKGRRFGLGLALVREVVLAHGGALTLDGAPGVGATATVTLPAAL